jgi:uncharacterized protein (DUF1684 family)
MTDEVLTLLDWKRRIFALYAAVRAADDPAAGWRIWRDTRDELFRTHPQSPLPPEARRSFRGLGYFDYDPTLRTLAQVATAEPEVREVQASAGETIRFRRFGRAELELDGGAQSLDLFWLDAYGGGVYLPVADATSGGETYGGGRYVLDTVKGADLGSEGDRLVLDFNFAYNPSCAYDPRWVCPLAPPGNRLTIPLRGGELGTWSGDLSRDQVPV